MLATFPRSQLVVDVEALFEAHQKRVLRLEANDHREHVQEQVHVPHAHAEADGGGVGGEEAGDEPVEAVRHDADDQPDERALHRPQNPRVPLLLAQRDLRLELSERAVEQDEQADVYYYFQGQRGVFDGGRKQLALLVFQFVAAQVTELVHLVLFGNDVSHQVGDRRHVYQSDENFKHDFDDVRVERFDDLHAVQQVHPVPEENVGQVKRKAVDDSASVYVDLASKAALRF